MAGAAVVATPDVTAPEVTAPEVTAPEVTAPEVAAPDVTNPVVAAAVPGVEGAANRMTGVSVPLIKTGAAAAAGTNANKVKACPAFELENS